MNIIKELLVYAVVIICGLAIMIFCIVMFSDGKCTECEEKKVIEQCDEQITKTNRLGA